MSILVLLLEKFTSYSLKKISFEKAHGNVDSPRLASSLNELAELGAVPTLKRNSLKQRLKAKRKLEQLSASKNVTEGQTINESKKKKEQSSMKQGVANQKRKRKNKKSVYRDESGARKKKRF